MSAVSCDDGLYRESDASSSNEPRSCTRGDTFEEPTEISELRREWYGTTFGRMGTRPEDRHLSCFSCEVAIGFAGA